jgi:hypothetical protein
MRSLLAFVLLAGAACAVATSASSRPTISLDLGSLAGLHKSPYEQHAGIACKISTTHKLCRKRTSSGPHNPHSESKYSKTCIAKAANAKYCVQPRNAMRFLSHGLQVGKNARTQGSYIRSK